MRPGWPHKVAVVARILAAAGLFWLWYLGAAIYIFAERDETVSADAAIVLGAAAWGQNPSPVFRERINHAIALYRQGLVQALIFTGGQGERSALSEAEVARRYALARGVPAGAIFIEDRSTNTRENLGLARAVAQAQGFQRLLIVSTPYHMRRAMHIARDLGLDAYASPTRSTRWLNPVTQTYALAREVVSYAHYLLVGELILAHSDNSPVSNAGLLSAYRYKRWSHVHVPVALYRMLSIQNIGHQYYAAVSGFSTASHRS